jgi:hypothetical protein
VGSDGARLHRDWNVIYVPDGTDFQTIIAANIARQANGNHRRIVYRTTKGVALRNRRARLAQASRNSLRAFFEALPLPTPCSGHSALRWRPPLARQP